MHRTGRVGLVAIVAAALAVVAAAWAGGGFDAGGGRVGAQDVEAQALQLERQLMCPRCINVRLDHCELAICEDMRAEIREQLAAGRGGDDILLYFSDRYGDSTLAELPREGFNLWLFGWVGASILLVGAVGGVGLWRLRRTAAPAPGGALRSRDERWLDDQLRRDGEGD